MTQPFPAMGPESATGPGRSVMELTGPERSFDKAQQALFQDLGLDIQSRYLHPETPAKRIHALETGDGEPVLMIHGGNSVAAGWAPLWAHLEGRFHIYAPDRPGCGLTHRQNYKGVRYRQHAVEFIRDTMDGLGLERATLVGNSVGGYWALAFTIAHPERVDRLVLIGEPAGSTPALDLKIRLMGTPVLNRLLLATLGRPRRDPSFLRGLIVNPAQLSASLMDCFYAAARLPGAQESWRTMLELIAGPGKPADLTHALVPEFPALRSQVLFCWAEHDLAPVAAGVKLQTHMKDARLEVIPSAGLIAWIDQPRTVARLLTEFIDAA